MKANMIVVPLACAALSGCGLWTPGSAVEVRQANAVLGSPSFVKSTGLVGAEDVTIHPGTGIAYISADDRWGGTAKGSLGGSLWAYDTGKRKLTRLSDSTTDHPSFHPHGISLWRDPKGLRKDRLFVINHAATAGEPEARNVVEIFEVDGAELRHVRTISDRSHRGQSLVYGLNDLTAVGPERFYATHPTYDYEPSAFGRVWDTFTTLFFRAQTASKVVYFDGRDYHDVYRDIGFANGVTADVRRGNLYVSSSQTGEMFVFGIDATTGRLKLRQRLAVGGLLDNIEWHGKGVLLVSSHSSAWRMLASIAWDVDVPGRLLRMEVADSGEQAGLIDADSVQCLYESDGAVESGLSVAAVHGKILLFGQVYRKGIGLIHLH